MPKITVIIRKAYGGAYDVMSSKVRGTRLVAANSPPCVFGALYVLVHVFTMYSQGSGGE